MPSGPRWNGKNRHAQEAADREEAKKSERNAKAAKARDDAEWGDDRNANEKRREEKRLEEQRKAEEARLRKLQRDQELAAEEAAMAKSAGPAKVLRRDAQREATRAGVSAKQGAKNNAIVTDQNIPTSNANHADDDDEDDIVASGNVNAINDALAAGGAAANRVNDRHIGRRARVAYKKFAEMNLPLLKEGNKKLRRTQLNDMLWAMWQKSPENPFVQRAEDRAAEDLRRKWFEGDDDDEDADA